MKQMLAVLLSFVLASSMFATPQDSTDVQSQVAAISVGSKVDVNLNTGEHVRGELLSKQTDSLTVKEGRKQSQGRTIPLQDVRSIQAKRRTHTPAVAWIAAGAIVAAVVIVVAVVLIERHNE